MIYYCWCSLLIYQLYFSVISHIDVYVINAHININAMVPIIYNIFINIQLGFGFYITDCTVYSFKDGIHIITNQGILNNTQ